jgi:hypothetical protein
MLHRVLAKADRLEVVQDMNESGELSQAVETLNPEWVIFSTPFHYPSHSWVIQYPSIRFVFLSPGESSIKVKWQTSCEENYPDLSLRDFIHILEKDLQRT